MKLADSHALRAPSAGRAVAGVVLVATLAAGLVVSISLDLQRSGALRSPYPLNETWASYPPINTMPYQRTCAIVRAWADRTAIAFCAADHGMYRWDPAQGRWSPITTLR